MSVTIYRLRTAYVRQAEILEINPNPIPHVHPPHEEMAVFCKWTAWFITAIGVFVTCLLTATAIERPMIGAVTGIAVFLTLEFGVMLSIDAATPDKTFAQHFQALYLPWLAVLLVSVSAVLLDRSAGPVSGTMLTKYSPAVWCGIETALLCLGAYAFLGQRRFGWSGEAVRQLRAIEARLAELRSRIDFRDAFSSDNDSFDLALSDKETRV